MLRSGASKERWFREFRLTLEYSCSTPQPCKHGQTLAPQKRAKGLPMPPATGWESRYRANAAVHVKAASWPPPSKNMIPRHIPRHGNTMRASIAFGFAISIMASWTMAGKKRYSSESKRLPFAGEVAVPGRQVDHQITRAVGDALAGQARLRRQTVGVVQLIFLFVVGRTAALQPLANDHMTR